MTKYNKTINTKQMIANSLKDLMQTKSLTKITINDISKNCCVNRNTFYYHFTDIYDLLKWMLEQDTTEIVEKINDLENIEIAIDYISKYIEDNIEICKCICHSLGKIQLKQVFHENVGFVVEKIINNEIRKNEYSISNNFKDFLIKNYCELIAINLINAILEPSYKQQKKYKLYISLLFNSTLSSLLSEASAKHL